jgi:hypothetical protein
MVLELLLELNGEFACRLEEAVTNGDFLFLRLFRPDPDEKVGVEREK